MLGLGLGIQKNGFLGGVESLLAVDFAGKGYVQGDGTGLFPGLLSHPRFCLELYIDGSNFSSNEYPVHFSVNNTSSSNYLAIQRYAANRIRVGYTRAGGYFYRRDYVIPTSGYFHFMYCNASDIGGSNRERAFVDGVEVSSVSAAYVASGILHDPMWIVVGGRTGGGFLTSAKLAYFGLYIGTTVFNEPTNQPYYDNRLNLDARRASKPLVAGINKPDIFYTANDINDLSINWTDSNAGIVNTEYGTLTNTDIIKV